MAQFEREMVMATIQLLNKKYKVEIRKKGYPSVNKRFHTLGDARKFARDIESQMERGTFEDYTGASLIAILCASLGKPICELGLRMWNNNLQNENSFYSKFFCL